MADGCSLLEVKQVADRPGLRSDWEIVCEMYIMCLFVKLTCLIK